MSTISHSTECVTRVSCLPTEDKPRRHKFYKFLGKETVNLGDWVYYIDDNDHVHPDDKKCYMTYLSDHQWHRGVVDRINEDGYIFVTK